MPRMSLVSVADLAEGAATLELDASGTPLTPLLLVDLSERPDPRAVRRSVAALQKQHAVVVGVTDVPPHPETAELVAVLTTVVPEAEADLVSATVEDCPVASLTLDGLLRVTEVCGVREGLVAESLAYSMLLAGREFRRWRSARPVREVPIEDVPVLVHREADVLSVLLNSPARHNAFSRALRDHLLEALALAEVDPELTVDLRGVGKSFCSGGDLDEFGTAADPAVAHIVRQAASAGLAVHRLRDRVQPVLHGACIGAGVEIPLFASRVVAHGDAVFCLPELSMGLVPGAGGTVSITRRAGRQVTARMALTGLRYDVRTAMSWGLVDGRA